MALPTASLSASPSTILQFRDSSLLTWSTTNATTASIDQGIGSVALSGSRSVTPAASTTYTLTATGAGGSATATADVTVIPRRQVHFFSTGTLFAMVGGVPVEFAVLQNIIVSITAAKKLLYESMTVARHPIDVAFADATAVMQAQTASISPAAIVAMVGGSLNTGAVPNILTLAKTISKLPFQAVLTLQDTTGKQAVWTFNRVFCPSLTLPVRATDFVKPKFPMIGQADSGGILATVSLPM